jgi:hypothetical protein
MSGITAVSMGGAEYIIAAQQHGIRVRSVQSVVAAEHVDVPGEWIAIPRLELVAWHSEMRDWRRIKIAWNGAVYVVSRAVWDSALPMTSPAETRQASAQRKQSWL